MNKQILQTKKEMGGITLIALVVTIIVLLILAGVSIATLTGDNGILTQANNAKTATTVGEEKEAIAIAYNGAVLDAKGDKVTSEGLNSQFNINGTKATASGEGTIKIDFETGRSYIIDSSGNVKENINISPYVKIGDYVDYHPDEVTTPYDKFGETYSGYANGEIGQDSTLQWRVLNINNDGTIDLICNQPTSSEVYFSGARGYNNGVAILNDYCKTMYSNKSKGAVGRSLNIEDIQEHMKTNAEGKKAYESYTSETGTIYKTGTYSYSSNKWYPLQWKNDNGVKGESEPKKPTASDIKAYTTENEAKAQETGDLTVTQTYWYLNSNEMSSNLETADVRDSSKANTMYYELLCNNGSGYYWLASRCVNSYSSSYAYFGLRRVYNGGVSGYSMFRSYSGTDGNRICVRPVVSLTSNVLDLNTDYETVGKWNLKQ